MRVVSLLPSATEIIYALDLSDQLVGVTFECDQPEVARREKAVVVGGPDTSGWSPADIDAYVRRQSAAGADLYTLHADALAALAPELIITQDLCRVCALPSGQLYRALRHLGVDADVISLDPHSLGDVLDSIETIGRRLDAAAPARQLVASLRARLADVSARVAHAPRPRVALLEWTDPPFTAGHWIPDLIAAAGGDPVAAAAGANSTRTDWAAVRAAAPDVVLVAPCGFDLAAATDLAAAVAEQVPGVPVWAIDGNAVIVRPGPRLLDGVEAIAAILHPDRAAPLDPRVARPVRAGATV